MSAPVLGVLLPPDADARRAIAAVVDALALTTDQLPPDFPCQFSAQRREDGRTASYLLIEHSVDATPHVDELLRWERPAPEYKELVAAADSRLTVTWRGRKWVVRCLRALAAALGEASSRTVVENDRGCLLRLSDVVACLRQDPQWSWERETFPDLPGVAPSEWL
ncbi:MAG TPA: hypothetical protein VF796_18065 [Humisphaera sp.]